MKDKITLIIIGSLVSLFIAWMGFVTAGTLQIKLIGQQVNIIREIVDSVVTQQREFFFNEAYIRARGKIINGN